MKTISGRLLPVLLTIALLLCCPAPGASASEEPAEEAAPVFEDAAEADVPAADEPAGEPPEEPAEAAPEAGDADDAEAEPASEEPAEPAPAPEVPSAAEAAVPPLPSLSGLWVDGASAAHGAFPNGVGLPNRWTLENGVLLITGQGSLRHFSENDLPPWYAYRDEIRVAVVGDGIDEIGNYAFYGLEDLRLVRLPYETRRIGRYAFAGCSSLTSITIPGCCGSIDDGAFQDCSALAAIALPSAYHEVNGSFGGCASLTDVYYASSYDDWCAALVISPMEGAAPVADPENFHEYAELPDAGRAWCPDVAPTENSDGCSGFWLDNRNYMYEAEDGGSSLYWEDVALPAKASSSGSCGDDLTWTLENDTLTIRGEGPMYDYGGDGETAPWHDFIPESGYLTVDIGEGVTSIGQDAFNGGAAIRQLDLPDSLQAIGDRAFRSAYVGDELLIPPHVVSIGEEAFSHCYLWEASLPDSLQSIGDRAFYDCSSMEAVTLPAGPVRLGEYAFSKSGLTSVNIPGPGADVGRNAFSECGKLAEIGLGNGCTLGYSAFYGCEALTEVTLPAGTNADAFSFSYCFGLERVCISRRCASLPDNLLTGCGALTDVYYGGSETDWNRKYPDGVGSVSRAVIHFGWQEPGGDVLTGDADGNGAVDPADRAYLARHLAGWEDFRRLDADAADMDGDGSVTRADRVLLARTLAD